MILAFRVYSSEALMKMVYVSTRNRWSFFTEVDGKTHDDEKRCSYDRNEA